MKVARDTHDIDLNACILWQYDKAYFLHKVLQNEYDFYDFCVHEFWRQFYDDVFNVATAQHFGLMRWASILGVSTYYVEDATTNSDGSRTIEGYGEFSDEFLRRLIIAHFFLLDSNGSCEDFNTYLRILFGVSVTDPEDETKFSISYDMRAKGDARVFCYDVAWKGIYDAEALEDTAAQHPDGNYTRPMEIYYKTIDDDDEAKKYEHFTHEEQCILKHIENRRAFFPHPAGVMVNGIDEDAQIVVGADRVFGFEFEDLGVSQHEDYFNDQIRIRPMNWARMNSNKDY